jgi:FdhD protein
MGIPILVSRSGLTQQGLVFARQVGVTLIARAKGQHFLVYNGVDNIVFDAKPALRPQPAPRRGDVEGGRIVR